MTIEQFKTASDWEQQCALRTGVLLADRQDDDHDIYLFQLNAFYVEVYCHKQYRQFSKYHPFDNMDALEPYLEKIEISL